MFKDFTNLDANTLHPGDENVGTEEPPHGLSPIHGELPTVEILIDVRLVRFTQSHIRRSLTRVSAVAVVVVEALVGAFVVLHRRIGGSGSGDPILLERTAAAAAVVAVVIVVIVVVVVVVVVVAVVVVVVVVSLFFCNQSFARSLSWKHIVQ